MNLLYFDNGYLYWKSKVEQAAVYRWTSTEAFVSFLEEEYQKVAPKKGTNKDNSLNYYAELVKELEARGVRV